MARARKSTCPSPENPSLSVEARASGVWTGVGLALVFAGPLFLASPPAQKLYEQAGPAAAAVGQLSLVLLAALVVAILRFGERQPLRTIGLVVPRARPILAGLAIGVGVYVALGLAAFLLTRIGALDNAGTMAMVLSWSRPFRIVIALVAGIVEEVLYRGYAIERLTAVTGRRGLSAAMALAAFALAHVPFWGWAGIATPLLGGAFFTVLYLWRRDLVLCISAHATIDLIGLVLLPAAAGLG